MRKYSFRKNIDELKNYYKEVFSFISKSKKYIFTIIFLFLISTFLGFFAKISSELKAVLLQKLQELFLIFNGLNVCQTIWMIFSNNIYVAFLSIVLGVFFGFFPVFFALSNGFIIGYVMKMSVESEGFFVLWKLFPHGIFELPAIFISMALGLQFGMCILFNRKNIKDKFKKTGKTFLLIVVPLLIIASIIEGVLIFAFK